ncbi:MAG: hypothetical protein HUJ22_01325 [Gracilimonas sp.]|uniref:hypothetical protein n=1 Tax=Gracilimonas sp. TaxID=1974203 RepID=UPI001987FCF4|nr:hypothetical protein [Gracilimonas sp.]MBD3615183.1 hypothetical protein [Gracilimonas sp.]
MKRLKQLSKLLLVIAIVFTGCEGQEESLIDDRLENNPPPTETEVSGTQGATDFTKFITIGSSITAGYMDGALYNLGQGNSIAALMAAQLEVAVESDGDTFDGFVQPNINSEAGYNTVVSQPGGVILGRFKLDTNIPGPSPVVNGEAITAYTGPDVHNFGVPGIQVGQLLTPATGGPADPGNPAFNPFYQRFASNPGSSTILGDAIASQPSFFSLWIGNNDVLGYAASGASNPAILTSNSDFDTRINATIGQLMGNTSADGIVANIPPLLGVALFQAVRWNNITLDEATATQLNGGLQGVNDAIQATVDFLGHPQEDADRRFINYSAGNNPILVIDEELEDLGPKFDQLESAQAISPEQRAALVPYEQSRPLTQGELVLISAGAVLGKEADGDASQADTPIGVVIPLGFDLGTGSLSGDQYYLTLAEQQEIEMSRASFNASISAAVDNYSDRLALYDTNAPGGVFLDIFGMSDGVPGIRVSGVDLQPDFSPNGVLSTDGVHPNARGNAIIVNDMLETIENKFGAELPKIEVLNLPSVQICAGDCASQQGGS